MDKLEILMPAHNEENSIEEQILNISRILKEKINFSFLICEDGSEDNTLEILNNSQTGRLRRKYSDDIKFDLNVDFQTDTGNHEAFLFQVMYEISEVYFSKHFKNNQGRIGFQYEHNSTTESGKIKFFFAALDYDNVKISDDSEREFYVRKVHVFLKKFQTVINVLTSFNSDLKSSTSKSKTFNSLITSMLRYESQNEFLSILYNLMVALHFDLEENITIQDLRELQEKE